MEKQKQVKQISPYGPPLCGKALKPVQILAPAIQFTSM